MSALAVNEVLYDVIEIIPKYSEILNILQEIKYNSRKKKQIKLHGRLYNLLNEIKEQNIECAYELIMKHIPKQLPKGSDNSYSREVSALESAIAAGRNATANAYYTLCIQICSVMNLDIAIEVYNSMPEVDRHKRHILPIYKEIIKKGNKDIALTFLKENMDSYKLDEDDFFPIFCLENAEEIFTIMKRHCVMCTDRWVNLKEFNIVDNLDKIKYKFELNDEQSKSITETLIKDSYPKPDFKKLDETLTCSEDIPKEDLIHITEIAKKAADDTCLAFSEFLHLSCESPEVQSKINSTGQNLIKLIRQQQNIGKKFIRKKYDVFIDGANILYFHPGNHKKDKIIDFETFNFLKIIYEQLIDEGYNPLIILHSRHKFNNKSNDKIQNLLDNLPIYYTPNNINDDLFLLYSVLFVRGSYLVTNDRLRDHINKFEKEEKKLIEKWIEEYVIRYDIMDNCFNLTKPSNYTLEVQKYDDTWYLPINTESWLSIKL